jgi:hypothetical protein
MHGEATGISAILHWTACIVLAGSLYAAQAMEVFLQSIQFHVTHLWYLHFWV